MLECFLAIGGYSVNKILRDKLFWRSPYRRLANIRPISTFEMPALKIERLLLPNYCYRFWTMIFLTLLCSFISLPWTNTYKSWYIRISFLIIYTNYLVYFSLFDISHDFEFFISIIWSYANYLYSSSIYSDNIKIFNYFIHSMLSETLIYVRGYAYDLKENLREIAFWNS